MSKSSDCDKSDGCCLLCFKELEHPYFNIFNDNDGIPDIKHLLLTCLFVEVKENPNKIQAICDECFNKLIENYDNMQIGKNKTPTISKDVPSDSVEEKSTFEVKYLQCDDKEKYINASGVKMETEEENPLEIDQYTGVQENEELEQNTEESQSSYNEKSEYDDIDFLDDSSEIFEKINADIKRDFDLQKYKKELITCDFRDIIFPEKIACSICLTEMDSHLNVVEHIKNEHYAKDLGFPCVIDSNCPISIGVDELSFHLVFTHYELDKLNIYTQCPGCMKRFSKFPDYNKHSCYTSMSISRGLTECEICQATFKSNKRYRFHQQFHLIKDHRPKCCFICDTYFDDENELFEHLRYGHEKNLGLICIECDKEFISKANLEEHKRLHNVRRTFKCKHCPKSYLSNQHLKHHFAAYHTDKKLECNICGKVLAKPTMLNKHMMSHIKLKATEVLVCNICGFIAANEDEGHDHSASHSLTLSNEDINSELNIKIMELQLLEKCFCCEYCEKPFFSVKTLNDHRYSHTEKQFKCNICPLKYDEYKRLKTHKITHSDYVDIRKTFPINRYYVCDKDDCEAHYVQWTSLRSHVRHKHLLHADVSCKICDTKFSNRSDYEDHLSKEHDFSANTCPFCSKSFTKKMAVAVHISRMHISKQTKCEECDEAFNNPYALKVHMDTIHRQPKCKICGKEVKNYKNLQLHHKMVHEKSFRFFCKYCQKGFFNNCDKEQHEGAVHEKLNRYKCNICDFKADYKTSLRIHMRTHNGGSAYKCHLCNKEFDRAYYLNMHIKRHEGKRDFQCTYEGCTSSFVRQGLLNAHVKKTHLNKGPPRRHFFSVPKADVFVDDDDGLDDGVIGEPKSNPSSLEEYENTITAANSDENESDESNLNASTAKVPAVIVKKNDCDHDYIVRLDDKKIFGNVIEEYEITDN